MNIIKLEKTLSILHNSVLYAQACCLCIKYRTNTTDAQCIPNDQCEDYLNRKQNNKKEKEKEKKGKGKFIHYLTVQRSTCMKDRSQDRKKDDRNFKMGFSQWKKL